MFWRLNRPLRLLQWRLTFVLLLDIRLRDPVHYMFAIASKGFLSNEANLYLNHNVLVPWFNVTMVTGTFQLPCRVMQMQHYSPFPADVHSYNVSYKMKQHRENTVFSLQTLVLLVWKYIYEAGWLGMASKMDLLHAFKCHRDGQGKSKC